MYAMGANPVFDRITVEPGKCGGKPCIRGMRITVRHVLEILATYKNREDLFREYPFLEEEDFRRRSDMAPAPSMAAYATVTNRCD
jgi:uncharacterized protein (DUF433 family)